jgi:tRNA U34 5-methylaminomethyl-2-thiouridine-forming methyltransferase MnmC
VYFDAFGSKTQPELWTQEVTDQLYKILQPNGLVVTYSVKGSFRRALIESGFTVEKIPGPPGKREMLRAIK